MNEGGYFFNLQMHGHTMSCMVTDTPDPTKKQLVLLFLWVVAHARVSSSKGKGGRVAEESKKKLSTPLKAL